MGSAVTITALLVTLFWNNTMAKYIVPVGSDVVATWSSSRDNMTFKHTTKEAIFDDGDIDRDNSKHQSEKFKFEVIVFNLPQPNSRGMWKIGVRASQLLRK